MKTWTRRAVAITTVSAITVAGLAPALAGSSQVAAGEPAASDITFHFYGAENCAPCMAFKRNHLPNVTAVAEDMGFGVAANVIARTRDVATVGSFGEADPILRKAAPQLRRVYPPIFFVTAGSEVLSVHDSDWRAAFEAAQQQAERAAS